ncbi:hypothetical protein MRB53_040198 [Persea americana]|nr:hypothetical protein MRB53_040198 [Persea americana]
MRRHGGTRYTKTAVALHITGLWSVIFYQSTSKPTHWSLTKTSHSLLSARRFVYRRSIPSTASFCEADTATGLDPLLIHSQCVTMADVCCHLGHRKIDFKRHQCHPQLYRTMHWPSCNGTMWLFFSGLMMHWPQYSLQPIFTSSNCSRIMSRNDRSIRSNRYCVSEPSNESG